MLRPMKPMMIISNFLLVMIENTMDCGFQEGRGKALTGFLELAFFMAAIYFFWSSVMKASKELPPLFFCALNVSMSTPTSRLRVKKDPKRIKKTKYMYM